MPRDYPTPDDVLQKLDSTICIFKNHPVFVRVVGFKVNLIRLDTQDRIDGVDVYDPELTFNRIRLGYWTNGDTTSYLTRNPDRAFSQGLAPNSIVYNNEQDRLPPDWYVSKPMAECILGIHQPFHLVLDKLLNKESEHLPFNRYFALRRANSSSIRLQFKGQSVATYLRKSGEFRTYNDSMLRTLERQCKRSSVPLNLIPMEA